jgi:hypothetical protein
VIFDELGQQLYGHNAPVRTPWEDVPVLIAVGTEEGRAMEVDDAVETAQAARPDARRRTS